MHDVQCAKRWWLCACTFSRALPEDLLPSRRLACVAAHERGATDTPMDTPLVAIGTAHMSRGGGGADGMPLASCMWWGAVL